MRYDSEEEADRHAGLRTRALPVVDCDFDADAPPADGWEYLARVRAEAATVPDVMVASNDPPLASTSSSLHIKETQDDSTSKDGKHVGYRRFSAAVPVLATAAAAAPAAAPAHAAVNQAWRREFLAWFSDVRADVARVVARREAVDKGNGGFGDFGEWDTEEDRGDEKSATSSFASVAASVLEFAAREEDDEDGISSHQSSDSFPVLSIVTGTDAVSTAIALRRHALAIEDRFFTGRAEGQSLCKVRAVWFFALAARVDAPLDADTSAAMRAAARGFAAARAATKSATDPSLPDLQVGLAIAGGYFGQDGE